MASRQEIPETSGKYSRMASWDPTQEALRDPHIARKYLKVREGGMSQRDGRKQRWIATQPKLG